MNLFTLVATAAKKANFESIPDYLAFTRDYLAFVGGGNLQAVIVSQNETSYRFFQYKKDGGYNVTRPINDNLMFKASDAGVLKEFLPTLRNARDIAPSDTAARSILTRGVYTIQQCIGAALDALPAGESNKARKVNGDLFERLVQLLIREMKIDCEAGTVQVPVVVDGIEQFKMAYQHDLLIKYKSELKIIGSVKTSSKDRIDKIFMDKFLYCKLTETAIPHIAIFLNDVQRKGKDPKSYGVNSTFLSGHFKAFTVKLNPLDGVYYCDIRPNMVADARLASQIKTIDHLFCKDLWVFLKRPGLQAKKVVLNGEIVEEVKS